MDERIHKLAEMICTNSLDLQPQEKLYISYGSTACHDLVKELITIASQKGAFVYTELNDLELEALRKREIDEKNISKITELEEAKIAYFEQEHHFDNPNLTPLEEIQSIYPKMDNGSIRSRLARCGIIGNIAISPIKNLSGGEQSKVKLCKIMLQKANILILDEPTNHLDKLAKEGLLEALKKYSGTVIFVSHESDFVNKLATKIYNIEDLLIN